MAERRTRKDGNEEPVAAPDSHTSSDPTADAGATLNLNPTVERNALGDPVVRDTGNDNAETVVPGTEPYTGSAAQLGEGNLGDTDVQWPPGRIETPAAAFATADPGTRTIAGPGRTDPDGPHPVVAALDAQNDGR